MSEELSDEVEAINSIYGENTLVPDSAPAISESSSEPGDRDPGLHYILTLPGDTPTSSLRLRFPAAYPAEPPAVLGTHSSGEHGRRGAAARDLALFRDAVGLAYQPGQVCVFDAIEEFTRLVEAADGADGPSHQSDEEAQEALRAEEEAKADEEDVLAGPEPPWVLSDPVMELKSTFIARCAPVTSPEQAARFIQHLLASDRRVRAATHNITAWRIRGATDGTSFQDCDDDGETAAGGRLLHLMQLMGLWDAVVVVTRWYGGHKLGPRRFAIINQVARDAFVKAGMVADPPGASAASAKKKGGHGHGK